MVDLLVFAYLTELILMNICTLRHLSNSSSVRAFTLIELLSVVAIVAILMAILIPAVGKIRDTAQIAQSTSNIRQLQQANALYCDDNQGRYLPPVPQRDGAYWWYQLPEYTEKLAYSGSPDAAGANVAIYRGGPDVDDRFPAFGYNRSGLTELEMKDGFLRSVIAEPAKRIAFMDASFILVREQDKDLYSGEEGRYSGASFEAAYRHGGQALVVFWDGHVRLVPREAAIDPENVDMWYPDR